MVVAGGLLRAQAADEAMAVASRPGVRLVLLAGDAGVGKSHLLGELAARLDADRAWGIAALAEVPGSTLAHLAPPADTVPALIRAVLAAVGPVLCVDDLQLTDPLSLALIERLLREPDRLVIATVRTDRGELPAAARALAREAWAAVIDVRGFTRDELDVFAAAELGAPLDARLGEELWRRTSGNPLHAAQVLRGARSDGVIALRDGVWWIAGELPVPASLRDAVMDRIDALGDEARSAAQWIAGLGEVPVARVQSSGRTAAVAQLVDAGIARVREIPQPAGPSRRLVVFSHPLFREVIWSNADGVRRQAVLQEHVEAERREDHPDPVRLAVLGLEVGRPVAAELMMTAARLAAGGSGSAGVEAALRLARSALAGATGDLRAEAVALAADALMQLGRAPEAAALVERELAALRPGPHAMLLAGLLHIVLTWGLADEPAASAMLARELRRYPRWTPAVREVFGFIRADGLTYAGRPAEALATTEGLKVKGTWRILGRMTPLGKLLPQVDARIVQSRAHALTQLARPAEAAALLTSGQTDARIAELEELIPSWRGNYASILSHATREAGRPRAGLAHAQAAYAATLDTGFVWGRAWAACNVAGCLLQLGDLASAAVWARRTIDLARSGHLPDAERLGLMLLSTAEGCQGRPLDDDLARRVGALPAGVGFLWHQNPIGTAWRASAAGQTALAAAALREGIDVAERDGAALAVTWLCHELLRLGAPGAVPVAGRIRRAVAGLAPEQTGSLIVARIALAEGVEAGDAGRLTTACDLFAGGEMALFAAEAAALAAAHSTGREAAALARRSADLAAQVGSPRTPLLAALDRRGRPDPLTRQERRIAELAAGHANAEIAALLHLSVRTVEGHLARAYAKLGITSRRELPAALSLRAE